MTTNIRWQSRVKRPWDQVYKAFQNSESEILHMASNEAADRTKEHVTSNLHSSIAGLEVHRDVIVEIENRQVIEGASHPRLVIDFSWRAAQAASFFPEMKAKLSILPVGSEAQLDFRGDYEPPGGIIGQAIDAMIGEKIAESSVRHFVDEIVNRLHTMIPAAGSQAVS